LKGINFIMQISHKHRNKNKYLRVFNYDCLINNDKKKI